MKKIGLMLIAVVAVAVAISPAAAATKKKAKKVPAATAQKYDSNDASWRLVKEVVPPLILPTWALPFYFHEHQEPKKKTKKSKM